MARTDHVVASVLVGLAVAVATWHAKRRCFRRRGRENFSFLTPLVVGAVTTIGFGAIKATGTDKKIGALLVNKGSQAAGHPVKAGDGSIAPAGPPPYQVTYRGRDWDGVDWSCAAGSVETGSADNSKACITSQFHPPTWRWDGKEWGHSCPNLTVPTDESQWEKKCEAGWTGRRLIDGKWVCPPGTDDSGATWEKNTWREAQKQCRVKGAYTTRVAGPGGTWVCPEGSKDTGLTWSSPKNGGNQCKWVGG